MKADTEDIVEIDGLHFAYNSNVVFSGLSLKVPRGKVVAILGTSGCGKSTLLKLIGGQLRPSRGAVRVNDEVVHELGTDALYAMRRKMGMMFQTSGLFTDLTVYENVAFPIREHTALPEELVRTLVLMKLHAVGLRGAHGMRVGDLSGGMTRRVALARAIAMDPMLAMYDEPFAGLDPISLNVVASLVRRLNDALGATSIIVTYDVSESLKIVDRLYVISEGVAIGEGTPAELLASEDPRIQQFLHMQPDGPVKFHYPARPIRKDLRL
jgi:phospholipid/cholesterol/gamma-HCH transport system ATP-binding protein